jgi:DtxR family Mn-dependent transcriptional regulator
MSDPRFSLLVGLAVLAVLLLLFWPGVGLVARWRRAMRLSERVRTEDALKHLQDLEYRHQTPSLQSLSGALGLPPARAVELLSRMEALGLTRMDENGPRLTPEGRAYALRMIRIHRLWERHLAEETGWREEQWHRQAEVREHTTSIEEADELAERMGHPRFDPHGDPIPTAAGELPKFRGQSLPTIAEGAAAAIVHLEDEPETVYSQLVAEGLHPGMKVQVIEATASRIRFWADGDEHVLAPVLAANITVVPLPEEVDPALPAETLGSLRPGEDGWVRHLAPGCRGQQRRRLMDLGILPGTHVTAEIQGPGGSPTAFRVRGALVALRGDQTRLIHITRTEPGS